MAIKKQRKNALQQAKKSFSEKVGSFALGVGKNLLNPVRDIGGAAETIGLLATSPTFRKASFGGQLNPQEVQKMARYKPTFLRPEVNTRMGQVAQGVKSVAGIASYGVPFGKGVNFATKFIAPGFATGALQGASDRLNPASIIGGGLLGAAGAGTLGLAGKAFQGMGRFGKLANKKGGEIRSGVSKIYEPASVFGASKEIKINKTLNELGIKGGSQAKYEKLQPSFQGLSKKIKAQLRANPKQVNIRDISLSFKKNLKDKLRTKELVKKSAQKEIKGYLSDLGGIKVGKGKKNTEKIFDLKGKINTEKIFDLKRMVNRDYKGIAKKIKNNTHLSNREKVIEVARKTFDDVITKAHPSVKKLTLQQSDLYSASTSLNRVRKTIPTSRFMGTTIPKSIAEGGIDRFGAGVQSLGNTLQGVGKLSPPLSNMSGQIASRIPLSGNLIPGEESYNEQDQYNDADYSPNSHNADIIPQNMVNAKLEQKAEQARQAGYSEEQIQAAIQQIQQESQQVPQEQMQVNSLTGYTPEELYQGYLKADQAGNRGAAAKLYKLFEDETAYQNRQAKSIPKPKAKTEKQLSYQAASEGAQYALNLLEGGDVSTGFGQGIMGNIGERIGLNSDTQQDYRSTVTAARGMVLNALAGANVPPAEFERLSPFIPAFNYAPSVAKQKLRTFIRETQRFSGGEVAPTSAIYMDQGE